MHINGYARINKFSKGVEGRITLFDSGGLRPFFDNLCKPNLFEFSNFLGGGGRIQYPCQRYCRKIEKFRAIVHYRRTLYMYIEAVGNKHF